jgi:protein-S-isoprenylcysteine O-methyltransferase Ste14
MFEAVDVSTPAFSARARQDNLLVEGLLRMAAVAAYFVLVVGVFHQWRLAPERWSLVVLLAAETLTLGLMVFAREARLRDMSPIAATATLLATFYFVFLGLSPGRHLVPEAAAVTLQAIGMAWQAWAKLTLGRSFGLLPAHRGVVTSGPYALVRHPIYLGYLVAHVGFLLANFSGRNAVVLAVLYGLQVTRMVLEERVLCRASADYRAYTQRVRWRFVPGVL